MIARPSGFGVLVENLGWRTLPIVVNVLCPNADLGVGEIPAVVRVMSVLIDYSDLMCVRSGTAFEVVRILSFVTGWIARGDRRVNRG